MNKSEHAEPEQPYDPFGASNTYFCDPYHTRLQQ